MSKKWYKYGIALLITLIAAVGVYYPRGDKEKMYAKVDMMLDQFEKKFSCVPIDGSIVVGERKRGYHMPLKKRIDVPVVNGKLDEWTLRYEIGHAYFDKLPGNSNTLKAYRALRQNLDYYPTKYSERNTYEHFAECFAFLMDPEYDGSMPDELEKAIRAIIEEACAEKIR